MTIADQQNTNTALPLDSLSIKGYRGFKDLTIPKLGRVNLITGKNSVGKTSFLEAIYLKARRGSPEAVWQVLCFRDPEFGTLNSQSEAEVFDAVIRIFHDASPYMNFASDGGLEWGLSIGPAIVGSHGIASLKMEIVRPKPETDIPVGINAFLFGSSETFGLVYALRRIVEPDRHLWVQDGVLPSAFVGPKGLNRVLLGRLWDSIAFSPTKGNVIQGLRLINPEIQDVNLFGEAGISLGRVPNVKLSDDFTRHPINEFGDGMSRLFDIMLALSNSGGGILTLDEIENGLHYSIHADVWRLIFDTAARLNVQVFATTHSWECIEAFQMAASESEAEGALIRLQNKTGGITATVFDEEDLEIITRDQLEVR
jgi:hypothetical protein